MVSGRVEVTLCPPGVSKKLLLQMEVVSSVLTECVMALTMGAASHVQMFAVSGMIRVTSPPPPLLPHRTGQYTSMSSEQVVGSSATLSAQQATPPPRSPVSPEGNGVGPAAPEPCAQGGAPKNTSHGTRRRWGG